MDKLNTTPDWTTQPDRDTTPRAWENPYGSGVYRRAIVLVNDPGRSWGELEDDFHHFRIELIHDGSTITEANGLAIRGPWSTCYTAPDEISAMVGVPVGGTSTSIGSYLRARDHCTHLFDVAGLTAAHIKRSTRSRRYDISVIDRDEAGNFVAVIARDDVECLRWEFEEGEITSPERYVGVALRSRFIRWAEDALDAEEAEAAIALRRSLDISMGRIMDLDQLELASDVGEVMAGKCYTYSDVSTVDGLRIKGSGRDFTQHPETLLDHLEAD
ncbi:MAG: DUF2889 domain-containing protein, partial [Acidobacteria bacterium]|nr:DUF2889 domain-containing protein [Acidobacteriota bacterium]